MDGREHWGLKQRQFMGSKNTSITNGTMFLESHVGLSDVVCGGGLISPLSFWTLSNKRYGRVEKVRGKWWVLGRRVAGEFKIPGHRAEKRNKMALICRYCWEKMWIFGEKPWDKNFWLTVWNFGWPLRSKSWGSWKEGGLCLESLVKGKCSQML